MGDLDVKAQHSPDDAKAFAQAVINDLRALEYMLDNNLFETGVDRIGAEQELCLVDSSYNPAFTAMEILEKLQHPLVVNEYARFNLEINLDPQPFSGNCFSTLENNLNELLGEVRKAAKAFDTEVVLVGILPTIRKSDMKISNMTPLPRYRLLNDNIKRMRGGKPLRIHISGTDELMVDHPSSLLEGCNTSFQVHMQVNPEDMKDTYNFAQLLAAPLLAVSTNSSLLFGKRLWKETRIALFQQSIDTRRVMSPIRERMPRVTFGNAWLEKSLLEIFRDDLARYRFLIHTEIEDNSLESLRAGKVPSLRALRFFNGTVYRWNRICYGIFEGKPHLRIENRILPSGPTVSDEIANAAFWLGMMKGMKDRYRNLEKKMPFDLVNTNFQKAAKVGLDSQFYWLDDQVVSAKDLILEELAPLAREGLAKMEVASSDIDRYMSVIESRAGLRRTGGIWLFESFSKLARESTRYEAAVSLTAALVARQKEGLPIHEWELACSEKSTVSADIHTRVEQIMITDIYTVQEEDLVELVTQIMTWKKIRHLPVENDRGQLVGLITAKTLLAHLAKEPESGSMHTVRDLMIVKPVIAKPETTILEAMKIMHENRVSCLPVVTEGKLTGILTEFDMIRVSTTLLERQQNKTP